ncbi:hypothetical protein BJX61DRAFT_541553 [Aspergillus egyptiacus]|nr:hypothetical protein BJX61DRAFT_541553 [Aspergillus egyptiacus]
MQPVNLVAKIHRQIQILRLRRELRKLPGIIDKPPEKTTAKRAAGSQCAKMRTYHLRYEYTILKGVEDTTRTAPQIRPNRHPYRRPHSQQKHHTNSPPAAAIPLANRLCTGPVTAKLLVKLHRFSHTASP